MHFNSRHALRRLSHFLPIPPISPLQPNPPKCSLEDLVDNVRARLCLFSFLKQKGAAEKRADPSNWLRFYQAAKQFEEVGAAIC